MSDTSDSDWRASPQREVSRKKYRLLSDIGHGSNDHGIEPVRRSRRMRSAASGGISGEPAPKVARLCGIPITDFLFSVDPEKSSIKLGFPRLKLGLHLPGPLF
ncbi:unnamed protein product [Miscanthus lutarioriparius]|uniref:Uncharacterized protein n=1 Tax=Miscanthus lutarioriparius TaxID=422564 RepID=A0A811SMK6_9POAL|nr:unnamed protein product [Miscanthus lutarioriparius]